MSDTGKYHLPKRTSAPGPYDLLVTPESAGRGCSGLRILTLGPGEAHSLSTQESEFLVLPLTGSCTVTTDGRAFELEGRTGVYGRKEDVPVELRGAGACSGQVDNYCLPGTFEAEQLLVCEVLTPGGNWSSYPPHKHDEARPGAESELEEIYCFEVSGEGGFGYQGVHGTAERPIDVLAEVRSGDPVLIPHGWHGPSIAAPGHDLYHLDVMAGPGQDRAWLICDDPAHGWVRATWAAQDIDDRLPFEGPTEQ